MIHDRAKDDDGPAPLDTVSETGHRWDVVLGISQRAINRTLKQIFDLYPEMAEMYNTDHSTGTIDAKLLAPTVLIPGGPGKIDTSKLLFQLRFESGRMLDSNGVPLIEDLTNWVISSLVEINTPKTTLTPDMSEKDKNDAEARNSLLDQYNLPGDYSVERLLLKLSSIKWSDFDQENTICGLDANGKPISFVQWAAGDSSHVLRLSSWVKLWSAQQDLQGRNIIGLSFKSLQDDDKQPPAPFYENPQKSDPRFAPALQINHISPYTEGPSGVTGFDGIGGCNALLYTEIVGQSDGNPSSQTDNAPPQWTNSFGGEPDDTNSFDGTLVLDRGLLVDSIILPHCHIFNYSTRIQAQDAHYSSQTTDLAQVATGAHIKLGREGDGSPGDSAWAFTRSSNPVGYSWYYKQKHKTPTATYSEIYVRNETHQEAFLDMDITHFADSKMVFNLENPSIDMSGSAYVQQDLKHNVQPRNDIHTQNSVIENEWSVQINLSWSGNGILQVQFVMGEQPRVYTRGSQLFQDGYHRSATFHADWLDFPVDLKEIKRKLEWEVNSRIEEANTYFKKPENCFVSQGSGVFEFGQPAFNTLGNLVTPVKLKPVVKKFQDLYLPRPPKADESSSGKNPDQPPTSQAGNDGSNSSGGGQGGSGSSATDLAWTLSSPISAMQNNNVRLKGSNTDPSATYEVKQIGIEFTSGSQSVCLFMEDEWTFGAAASVGAATMTVQSKLSGSQTLSFTKPRHVGSKWVAYLENTAGDTLLKLAPGDWIEVVWDGLVGAAGPYKLTVSTVSSDNPPTRHSIVIPVTVEAGE